MDALNRLLRELGRKPIETARSQPYVKWTVNAATADAQLSRWRDAVRQHNR